LKEKENREEEKMTNKNRKRKKTRTEKVTLPSCHDISSLSYHPSALLWSSFRLASFTPTSS
jgi:hypothetical protein